MTGTNTEATDNPYRYDSTYLDTTGLYRFSARYYDPAQGRFTQQDPSGQETNLYAYAGDNPASNADPTGLADEPVPPEGFEEGGYRLTELIGETAAKARLVAAGIPKEVLRSINDIIECGCLFRQTEIGPTVPEAFANDGRAGSAILPRRTIYGDKIRYTEWGSAQAPGSLGARIVTGSDGSLWYTPDHYKTFARVS